jgi:hypothetical protein
MKRTTGVPSNFDRGSEHEEVRHRLHLHDDAAATERCRNVVIEATPPSFPRGARQPPEASPARSNR